MRFILKEFIYIVGALCGIYSTIYILTKDDWQCQMWALLGAGLASYIGYKVCKFIWKRKDDELKDMAKRKKELENELLGQDRLSSGYEPNEHFLGVKK